jgi:TonB family protein
MRRVLFTALALLTGLAHAQVAASNGTRNPAAPLTLQAKVSTDAFARPVAYTAPATAPAAAPVARAIARPGFHDVIKTVLNRDVDDYASGQTATLEFRLGEDTNSTAPKLVHIVGRQLPTDVISDHTHDVAIRLVVNPQGVPEQLEVVHSAGAVVDARTLEAVRQYRFTPATMDRLPVPADVTVDVALQQQ